MQAWRCHPSRALGTALAAAVTELLSAHFCSAVECSADDPHTLVLPKTSGTLGTRQSPRWQRSERSPAPSLLFSIPSSAVVEKEVRCFIGQPEDWFFCSSTTAVAVRSQCPQKRSRDALQDRQGAVNAEQLPRHRSWPGTVRGTDACRDGERNAYLHRDSDCATELPNGPAVFRRLRRLPALASRQVV